MEKNTDVVKASRKQIAAVLGALIKSDAYDNLTDIEKAELQNLEVSLALRYSPPSAIYFKFVMNEAVQTLPPSILTRIMQCQQLYKDEFVDFILPATIEIITENSEY
jgi:hypothetical protein